MHVSALPPAESFDDLFPDPPATGLTDADLRAIWDDVGDGRAWRVAWRDLTDEEYRAYLTAYSSAYPEEDDDGPPDQVH